MELSKTIRKADKSTAYYFLRSRILHWLNRADREVDPKRRFESLEKARDLSKRLRDFRGFTKWWSAVAFASVCAGLVIGAAIYAQSSRKTFFYQYPNNYLRVVRNLDPCQSDGSCGYRFVVQAVTHGVAGPETEMHFCRDYQPRFEAGHTLLWIRYTDLGSCQTVGPEDHGYDILRDSNGNPVLPPGCHGPVEGHVACEGGKANFN